MVLSLLTGEENRKGVSTLVGMINYSLKSHSLKKRHLLYRITLPKFFNI